MSDDKCPKCEGDPKALIHSLDVCPGPDEPQDEVDLQVGVDTKRGEVFLQLIVDTADGKTMRTRIHYSAAEATHVAMILAKASHDLNELVMARQASNLVLPPEQKLDLRATPKNGSVLAKRGQRKR